MTQCRLALLLHRFGIRNNQPTASQLRAAYFREARKLHPDAGGRSDGADFVQLTRDYDEARVLLERMTSASRVVLKNASGFAWAQSAAAPTSTTWASTEHHDMEAPGLPPPLFFFVLGSVTTLAFVLSRVRSKLSKPQEVPVAPRLGVTGAEASHATHALSACKTVVDGAPLVRKASGREDILVTGYYSKRVKKGEPGDALKSRPHSKQRGSTYISPVHSAAEDGLAEWLHWAGERSKVSLCLSLDRLQQTPLHYGARAGQLDACAVLLKFQANPLAADSEGRTPLDLARNAGHSELAEMLEKGPPGPLATNQFRKKPSLRSQNQGIIG
mmetsp:Transcript_123068/g.244986  ORF Transcript_123068/g.244986 Transcript_123068/m.244986 type:complete len:329 (-) Transcript_123068:165-1151(-)|eukprot:CAMPEP_0172810592 /NCGR_PEP_ID=MMETSP1075-20121228/8894_1 /TAXON_ID=2916 /ORGANISM="Ceratium fusus, Strain PA161109" /LENGTH=328 /DNA_ID=CAMNT_0013649919 /DNA_START=82 /DNA_END=1068 /DNA_ORIENTATION=+